MLVDSSVRELQKVGPEAVRGPWLMESAHDDTVAGRFAVVDRMSMRLILQVADLTPSLPSALPVFRAPPCNDQVGHHSSLDCVRKTPKLHV